MVFSSFDFLFRFLPVFLFLYFICPERQRNLCLFVGSLVFYFYGSRQLPLYFWLLLLSMAVNFFIGRRIGRKWNGPERAVWLTIGIIYNLLWLMSFKYSAFFAENTNALLTYVGLSVQLPVLRPALPLGISFIPSRQLHIWRMYIGRRSAAKVLFCALAPGLPCSPR